MIDFTDCPVSIKTYDGANGSKFSIIYGGERYMLKFPVPRRLREANYYADGCVTEYIGCHIFGAAGIPVQETMLGTYRANGTERVVVACKDFATGGVVLQDFHSLRNTVLDIDRSKRATELSQIEEVINKQTLFDPEALSSRFWDMFIVDALIGNWDRHNGNWGFLYNEKDETVRLAPVFDCGSSLFPQMDEDMMRNALNDPREIAVRIYERPLSCITVNDRKINYYRFISSLENEACNRALARVVPRIREDELRHIVYDAPYISDLQKSFYTEILLGRKEAILDRPLRDLLAGRVRPVPGAPPKRGEDGERETI